MPCSTHLRCPQVWYGTPRNSATPANRWKDGRTDRWTECQTDIWMDRHQMLGYVMSFANWQVSIAKNEVDSPEASNVTNWWQKCNRVWGMVQWTFGACLQNICSNIRVVGHIQEKLTWPCSSQKWNCRALKINWHLGLGLRDIWCEYEKDHLKTLGFTAYTRTNKFGFPAATNGTAGCQKLIGI